jgi:hypothetical protein
LALNEIESRALWKTREKPFVPQCVRAGRLPIGITARLKNSWVKAASQ